MPAAISRNNKHRPSRRKNLMANQPQPAAPIRIVGGHAALAVLTLTFDQPVSLNGTPAFTTDVDGPTPISAVQTGPNIVAITFSASVAAATSVVIGFNDPAIRNASGGYVMSDSVAF